MLEFIVFVVMLLIPPVFALVIHAYLRHGNMNKRKKLIYYEVYLLIINLISYLIARLRGLPGFDHSNMTMTYKLKFLGCGIVEGFFVPFIVCLISEEQFTLGGLKRYTQRFLRDIVKYSGYAVESAKADLKSEVASSYLNWMWWLIEPFCMMLIYALIFGIVFKASEQYFPIFIFIGITMWSFFSRGVNGSIGIVRSSKGIISKVYLPKYILMLSKMFVNGFKMLVSFGIIFLMMVCGRVVPTWNILMIVPIILILFLFTFGVSIIMMHYGVYVNDLGYITGIVLRMLMYFTGTFYKVSKRVPAPFGEVLERYNPVAFLIASMRGCLLYGEFPDVKLLLLWGVLSIVLIALGAFTIYSNENAYVKVI